MIRSTKYRYWAVALDLFDGQGKFIFRRPGGCSWAKYLWGFDLWVFYKSKAIPVFKVILLLHVIGWLL
jgi:hypothetical protein